MTEQRKRASRDWVVMVAADTHPEVRQSHWHCERCGERVPIQTPIRVTTFAAMGKGFSDAHAKCRSGDNREEQRAFTPPQGSENARADAWISRGEVGMSSRAIWQHMKLGRAMAERWSSVAYPYDPDDFRRCRLLLRAVPEWRPRMAEMECYGPEWAALANAWPQLEAIYEAEIGDADRGLAPRLYARMKELIALPHSPHSDTLRKP